MKDLYNNIAVSNALSATAISSNTTTNGASVDLQGYESAAIVYRSNAYTDGTYTPNLQESTDGSTWTDVAAADILGTEAAISAANTVKKIGYNGHKRYIRLQVVSTSVTSGANISATAIRGHARSNPVA